ncbi:SDR family NAD(P)-dependent oxidoreductase [Alteriqipengyuania flavescens]|uniref:SDR family NAD(P)-dependent oxidoreductase n=1 Tax=Alteriqipengyuania flavescens TaxID=3053610 RepID=UPI0025B2B74F|nr:SDR family NAD(P)-dependent oxidoreductase [Alteriqipengyuania flavescens]WJY18897.1 SDR family NAD(P)-dependent oxidoreductase [Alteriqipengyuania flavescens]WJY24837.1 SDR family NAD(P)-dependent oxidoreductase [Alteriqipengyuania flavescens]
MSGSVWITGASSGIGRALALAWSQAGEPVILSGRNVDALEATAAECASDTLILPFEATNRAAMEEAVEQAKAWQDGVGTLVNNAGISQRSRAINTRLSVYQHIVDIDLMAPIALTQALLPHMVERGSGRLVFISSIAGKVGVPMRSAYCAAKHGLIGYADTLRAELSQSGVDVHVVAPGSVATDVSRNALSGSGAARGRSDKVIDNGIPPAEAALAILDAIGRGEREIIVARGVEEQMGEARRTEDAMFDQMAAMVASGYMEKMEAED